MAKQSYTNQTTTVTATVHGKTSKGIWIGNAGPRWSSDANKFIPYSQIGECDTEIDDIELGDEIEFEIPAWLAREKEL